MSTGPGSREESTARAAGRALQGLVLERLTLGVVLLGIVVVAAGLLEAEGARRLLVVLAGVVVAAVPVLGWRRQWGDQAMWGAALVCTALGFAAFVAAVS